MNFLKKIKNSLKDFDTVKKSKGFMIGSGTVILIGLLIIIFFGFNLGIDFTGGTVLKIKVGSTLEDAGVYNSYISQIETVLQNNNLVLSLKQQEGTGEDANIIFRFQDISGYTEEQMATVITEVKAELVTALSVDESQVQDSQRIGPSATASLLLNALLAVLIATVLILIYIAFRFELLSGLAAILALFHDILIMLALVAIFRLQINSAFIAALITIIGYSINDTIVVFDRVRENRQKDSYKNNTNSEVVNISIRETFTRTINTSLTTLFTITILAIISVPTIREFAIPIVFGLIAGTYSSIFITTPIWAIVNDKTRPKNKGTKNLVKCKGKNRKNKIFYKFSFMSLPNIGGLCFKLALKRKTMNIEKRPEKYLNFRAIRELSTKFNISESIVKLMFLRGVDTEQKINAFLHPNLNNVYDPFLLKDMPAVVNKINEAIKSKKHILIFGDYDVDGMSATSIVYLYLKEKGVRVDYFLPNRYIDEYGLTTGALDKIKNTFNPDLIITVDCGITAIEEVEYAKSLGMDIIITDHHEVPQFTPNCLIINPKIKKSSLSI